MDRIDHAAAHVFDELEEEEEEEEDDEEEEEEEDQTRTRSGFPTALQNLTNSIGTFISRYHLLPICIPLLLLVLSLSPFLLHSPFRPASALPPHPTAASLPVVAELRALRLLDAQHLALLSLYDRTSPSNSTRPGSLPVRRALSDLIALNSEIQRQLLPPDARGAGDPLPYLAAPFCEKNSRSSNRTTIDWKPLRGRYLLALCVSGQMSNRLKCLRTHLLFAAALDRALVLPSSRFSFRYDRVLEFSRINACVGRKVVLSIREFSRLKKNRVRVDRLLCYMANPPCLLDEVQMRRLKGMGIQLPKPELAWPGDANLSVGVKRVLGDVRSRFGSKHAVLAVGDLSKADVEEQWVMQPGGPVAHKCNALVEPNRFIKQTAERFVQTFLGKSFVALHFRRSGFMESCNEKKESCFFPIPQVAECILQVLEKTDSQVIYLSTDAGESETTLLQSLIVSDKSVISLIIRPRHASARKWDAPLYEHHLGGDDQVLAMLDRVICAMSNVFIGSSGSTFTEGILHMRKDWGLDSICDEYLCEGKQPSFIASKE